ncbi:MAG TPA: hypothetical protein VFZ42_00215 [Chitinophagaceae bacterium]
MKKLLFFVLIAVMLFSISCHDRGTDDQKPSTGTTTSLAPGSDTAGVAAALPNSAFNCLEASATQVDEWLATESGNNRYKRIVFEYFWEDRTSSSTSYTLVGYRSKRTDRSFDPTPYRLAVLAQCTPTGIGTSITLSGQQVSIEQIRRIWALRTGPGPHSLKFTPMVNAGRDHLGQPCNCPNYLIYKIDLVGNPTVSGGDALDSEYTNPSPPKPPSD